MTHWRKMFDNRFLGSWDLEGVESAKMEISEIKIEDVQSTSGKTEKKPVVYFSNVKSGKGMVMNRTNARAIAKMYGNDTSKWVGKKITVAVRDVSAFGQTTEALRVIE